MIGKKPFIEPEMKEFDDLEVIFEASNGQELCNLIKKQKPDIVLLDIEMPVMDGIKTTEFLKKKYPNEMAKH